jgi:hypothetical protein
LIFITQILFCLYAYYNAREEAAWSWPYRNLTFSEYEKETNLDEAHDSGGARVVMALLIAAVPFVFLEQGLINQIIWPLISIIIHGLCYWLVFDPVIAKHIGKNWDYIGSTADTDNFLIKHLGKNAGEIKAIVCAGIIILFNVFTFIL